MGNDLPYSSDLHIDTATTRLILDLLDSIRSSVPVNLPPEPDGPGKLKNDPDLDRLKNIMVLARQHASELEGIFDPEQLMRYIRYASDYRKIAARLEKLLEETQQCREKALKFAEGLAGILVEHLQMTGTLQLRRGENGSTESIPLPDEGIRLKVV